jgi:phosphate transport system substrate-binding protein
MNKGLAPIAFLFFSSVVFAQPVTISGSDTMILLGQRLSQQYERRNPGTKMVIRGGGAENAFRSLGSGVDIVQDEAQSTKFPVRVALGVQGIAVYVNKANPVNDLTISQLRAIFMGEIKNWKEVGGLDKPILLYAGESSTGTLAFFQQAILQGEEPYPFEGKANSKDLVDVIAANPNAIGYASLRYSPQVKVLGIKSGRTSLAVAATDETIRRHEYPISRYVYWHLSGKPTGTLLSFTQWTMSQEGQTVVESVGFEPLLPMDRKRALAKFGVANIEIAAGK